ARPPIALSVPARTRPGRWRLAGALFAVGVPLALWALPPPSGLGTAGWHTGLILLGAALGWLLEPLPDYLVALLMTAAWGVAGVVPLPVAFAGFASASWVVALGAFAVAAAMARSGMLFRAALLMLKVFPA